MPALSPRLLVRMASQRRDSGRSREAELWYRAAISASPETDAYWFDLGLLYKRQHRWWLSQQVNTRAAMLNPANEGAWWNLGIAATARNDWREARRAWNACGIEMPPGTGLPDMQLGLTPIRLQPHGRAEVVWTTRIDPARARIESVPSPGSGRRRGDVVLHDGVPVGERVLGGETVPVFDELDLLTQSPYSTFHAVVRTGMHDGLSDLERCAEAHGVAVQNWTLGIRWLSREVSEGHAPAFQEVGSTGVNEFGIAARCEEEAREFLNSWTHAHPSRVVLDLHLGLAGCTT